MTFIWAAKPKIRVDAGACRSLCPTCGFLLVIQTLSQMSLPLRSLTRLHPAKAVFPDAHMKITNTSPWFISVAVSISCITNDPQTE